MRLNIDGHQNFLQWCKRNTFSIQKENVHHVGENMQPTLKFIGQIKTPYKNVKECPKNIQPNGPLCQITLYDEYEEGLLGLVEGQSILILYWLENTNRTIMHQKKSDTMEMGTFALRSPHRPNPIGAAIVVIEKIEQGQIMVKGLDCLDNTQLIDIKPAIYKECETDILL